MDFASLIRRSFPFVIPGVFLGSLFPAWSPSVPLCALATGIAFVAVWSNRKGMTVFCCCLAFASGCFLSAREEASWDRDRPVGPVSGTVTIVRIPETDDTGTAAVFRFDSCTDGAVCPRELVAGTFSIRSGVSYGDTGALSCALTAPDADWRMYYAKDGIAYKCRVSSWEKRGTKYPFGRALFGFRSGFEEALSKSLPEPEAGLAKGLVIGGSRQLPDAVVADFRSAGLSHIVAVSGYNISIIAECFLLLGIVCFLSRPRAAVFSLFATVAFVFLSGAPASAVRAFGMSSVLVSAGWFGRRYASLWAIALVASVMLVLNPLLLRHDIGFLLSFAATAGIALSSPFIGRIVKRMRYGGFFAEAALLTFSANLFVMPVIFANFGTFSPVSFLANAIILPIVPFSMFCSALVGAVGMISPWLGGVFSFPAYAGIRPIIFGTEYMAGWSRSVMIQTEFGWVASVAWYAALGLAFLFIDKKRRIVVPEDKVDISFNGEEPDRHASRLL
ncbi:MAG: ComEC/Rec2 family competence protein [Candidatus Moraniibacteriota bacterium]